MLFAKQTSVLLALILVAFVSAQDAEEQHSAPATAGQVKLSRGKGAGEGSEKANTRGAGEEEDGLALADLGRKLAKVLVKHVEEWLPQVSTEMLVRKVKTELGLVSKEKEEE